MIFARSFSSPGDPNYFSILKINGEKVCRNHFPSRKPATETNQNNRHKSSLTTIFANELPSPGTFKSIPSRRQGASTLSSNRRNRNRNPTHQLRPAIEQARLLLIQVIHRHHKLLIHIKHPENKLLIPNRVGGTSQNPGLGLVPPHLELHVRLPHGQVLSFHHVDVKPHGLLVLQDFCQTVGGQQNGGDGWE